MGQFLSWLIRRRQADGGGVVDARGKAESRKLKFRVEVGDETAQGLSKGIRA